MNRLALPVVAFVSILTLVACGAKTGFGSLCDQTPAPAACTQSCDPAPGAATTCPGGFHCSPDGTCDAQCTLGGSECGTGFTCTDDGRCVPDGNGSGGGPDANCPAINFTPMPVTPSIGLVLDQSGSMFPPTSTRYAQMREALVGTTGVVTELESKAYFGAVLYTCDNNDNLDTTATPRALNNAAALRASIDSKTSGGNTPTHAGMNEMVASFAAMPPPAGSPPIIVLATDGLPNTCSNTGAGGEAASVAAAAAAYAAGIPVYVLAINQNSQHFQDVANAGQGWIPGQPNVTYYPVTNAQQLKQAFDTIINGVISCDLSLTSTIDDSQAMNGTVTVNGVPLMFGTDWILVNGNTIRLLGAACDNLKTTTNPMVAASFPCGAVIF